MPTIRSIEDLESRYPSAAPRVRSKKVDRLDDGLRAMLATSPFVLLATSGDGGRCDVSRGGPPGFVKPLDDRHVVVPDLNGNNLVDSFRNIVVNPHAALIVLVPGQDETMRIDGPAHLTDDDACSTCSSTRSAGRRSRSSWRPRPCSPTAPSRSGAAGCGTRRRGRCSTARWPSRRATASSGSTESFEDYVAANEEKIAAGLCADAPS